MMEMEERALPVKLSEQDVKERADELASVTIAIGELALRKKVFTTEVKGEDDRLKKRQADLSSAVHSHIETRLIKCDWRKDLDRKMAYLYRTDTGEVVQQRELTMSEMQGELY